MILNRTDSKVDVLRDMFRTAANNGQTSLIAARLLHQRLQDDSLGAPCRPVWLGMAGQRDDFDILGSHKPRSSSQFC
jgi:hypothetical protein